jgi:hypothetical protein
MCCHQTTHSETEPEGCCHVHADTIQDALRALGVEDGLIEHIVTTQLEPQHLAREAGEDLAFAMTGGEVPEGYVEVTCAGCGRKAAVPAGSIPPGKVPYCPACGAARVAGGSRQERRRRGRHRGSRG